MAFEMPDVCDVCGKDFERKGFSVKHGRVRCRFCGSLYQTSNFMIDEDDVEAPLLLLGDSEAEAVREFYSEYGVRYDLHRPLWIEFLAENYPDLYEVAKV